MKIPKGGRTWSARGRVAPRLSYSRQDSCRARGESRASPTLRPCMLPPHGRGAAVWWVDGTFGEAPRRRFIFRAPSNVFAHLSPSRTCGRSLFMPSRPAFLQHHWHQAALHATSIPRPTSQKTSAAIPFDTAAGLAALSKHGIGVIPTSNPNVNQCREVQG